MRTLIALGLALATALPAAAATRYGIDKAHSDVSFQVRHLLTQVRGEFKDFDGTIVMDEANPAASTVSFTIDAASIDTRIPDRDKHLRTEDFFWVEKHPTITFVSNSVTKLGENNWVVKGDLTMRGVTREVTLPVQFLGTMSDPWGNTKAGFATSLTLNRKDYGINWNKALDQGGALLGDDVQVDISLQGQAAPAEAAAGK